MRTSASLVVAVTLAALSLPASAAPRSACTNDDREGGPLLVVGLSADMQLVCFREKRPDKARSIGSISGLMRGDALVGIDYRVQDKQLYGVSRSGGIYRIDLAGAMATKVGNLTVMLEEARSASISIPPPTACASSATPARTCATTSLRARRSPTTRSTIRPPPR